MFERNPGADRASGARGRTHRPQQKRRKMRVIAGLRVGFALAARFGGATDRRHMRWIGLLARATARL